MVRPCWFMSLQLHFIRHGKTTAPAGCLVGASEVELTFEGRQQARQLAERLPKGLPCLCSPMLRTRQTLAEFRGSTGVLDVEFDNRLREIDFGCWEMKTFTQLINEQADINGWQEYYHFCFPGGESVKDFIERLQSLIVEWRQTRNNDRQLLIVTHGGVIRTMICLLLGLDHKNYLLFDINYGSWNTVVLHSHGGILTGLNR